MERMGLGRKIMYALGQFGWSLTAYAPANLINYYYMPPKTGISEFPPLVYQGAVLGLFTIIGLALASGRLFDAITDPLVAGMSDRSKSRFGKRRSFLMISVLPFALLSIILFLPPDSTPSILNTVWLFVGLLVYYWFFTLYVTPYYALISELGHDSKERLLLSTLISITWALGFALGSQVYLFKDLLQNAGFDPSTAFRIVVAAFSGLGFILMLFPILFVNEKKYGKNEPLSDESMMESLKSTFRNKDFLRFVWSDLSYWVALTLAQTGIVYYVTILLGLPEALTSFLLLIMFVVSFVLYVPTNLLAQRFGKKKVLLFGFLSFSIVYFMTIFLGIYPVSAEAQGYALVILLAVPIAIFSILPNAIVGDISEADATQTGKLRAAMFFGARTFMQKVGQTIGGLLFPSLLLLGQTPQNPIGIRLTSVLALLFLISGFIVFRRYREDTIQSILNQKEGKNT